MTVGSWEVALVVAKWLVLVATAGAVGAPFALVHARRLQLDDVQAVRDFLQKCALIGLFANMLWFLLQIGAVNRSGLDGMFDMGMGAILAQSAVGDVWNTRMIGFALLTALALRPVVAMLTPRREMFAHVAPAIFLLAAFAYAGHVSTLTPPARAALILHVFAVFLWIGALLPLLYLSRATDLAKVQRLMRNFGVQALVIVAVLVVAGVILATQLLQTPAELLTTHYGRVLLLKLLGVYLLLMLAATNRWLLVPRLASSGSATALQKSIHMEWIVALLVLAATSWMTTIVGPEGM